MRCIGVEKGLQNIENFLLDRGYNVKEFDSSQSNDRNFLNSIDFIVSTGEKKDFLGINNVKNNIPFISAEGLSPEDVEKQIIRSK
jgi:galactitol-specific phosphotransferase system IIB component